ncbi:hypothetical protein BYT27DRAFT_7173545 [Phlegmacium glaucopus]|nr:hypothetical protein BYT27DRAFT_7173545 [Phlegmacium glaucopus]
MLVKIPFDLQITICTFLHPSDILALRQTCKAFQLPTRQRFVWEDALRRVCINNTLFLPSFPIPDLTILELEHAAMAPRRWIELCTAVESHDSGAELCSRTIRIINSPFATRCCELFIVPGGRYLVGYWPEGIFVWDLGYTSNADCKLIASVECKSYFCMAQATPDDMGLVIFSSRRYTDCSVYEIYPQSETPQLTRIAHLNFSGDLSACLLPDKVIWYGLYEDKIVVRVWDFRRNHSTSFSADFDVGRLRHRVKGIKVLATMTAIIVLCKEGILVWAIPPLSPEPLDFSDYDPAHIPPLVEIPFPDGTSPHTEFFAQTSHWYLGSSQPLYFDVFCKLLDSGKVDTDRTVHRFKIIVEPDLHDTSLHLIYTSEVIPNEMANSLPYMICEDTLVAYWYNPVCTYNMPSTWVCVTGLTSTSGVANGILHDSPAVEMLLPQHGYAYSLCPASGKLVHLNSDTDRIFVMDFL